MSAPPSLAGPTLGEALDAFRARHRIDLAPERGGVLRVRVGPILLPFPNPGFLRLHDLHHVLLDVPPNFWGEVEVSAFELRTGCPSAFVWFLCVASLALSFLAAPRWTVAAWRRHAGRRRNLYAEGGLYAALLRRPIAEIRAALELPPVLNSPRCEASGHERAQLPRSG
jgi:hypothetical protein